MNLSKITKFKQDKLNYFRENKRKTFTIISIFFLLVVLPLTLLAVRQVQDPRGRASEPIEVFIESGGSVVMEAENFDFNITNGTPHSWKQINSGPYPEQPGDIIAMKSDPNNGTVYYGADSSPEMIYNISFTKTGTYYVYLRTSGAGQGADSVHVGIDGGQKQNMNTYYENEGNFTSLYSWSNGSKISPIPVNITSAGYHTFHIWMREDGAKVDRIRLVQNANWSPPKHSDFGPNESIRSTILVGTNTPTLTPSPTPTNTPTPTPSNTPTPIFTSTPTPTPTPSNTPTPTPVPVNPSITASPTSIAEGGTVNLDVNGAGNTEDWVGLFKVGDSSFNWIDYQYLNGSKLPPLTPIYTAQLTFTMPAELGFYEFRLFENDTYNILATSEVITVGTPTSPTPTTVVTPTNTPTPTAVAQTLINFDKLILHGVGIGGDNTNPTSTGNPNPLTTTKTLNVEFYDSGGILVSTVDESINYSPANGYFSGSFPIDPSLNDIYVIKVKTHKYIRKTLPGIITINPGTTNNMPSAELIVGDINSDGSISLADYEILIGCYSDLLPARDCDDTRKFNSDLNDDGSVNQFDYNLFLRELSVTPGD